VDAIRRALSVDCAAERRRRMSNGTDYGRDNSRPLSVVAELNIERHTPSPWQRTRNR